MTKRAATRQSIPPKTQAAVLIFISVFGSVCFMFYRAISVVIAEALILGFKGNIDRVGNIAFFHFFAEDEKICSRIGVNTERGEPVTGNALQQFFRFRGDASIAEKRSSRFCRINRAGNPPPVCALIHLHIAVRPMIAIADHVRTDPPDAVFIHDQEVRVFICCREGLKRDMPGHDFFQLFLQVFDLLFQFFFPELENFESAFEIKILIGNIFNGLFKGNIFADAL